MKTYAWHLGLGMVFLVSGVLAVSGALCNVGHVTWSAMEGLRPHAFPSDPWRMVAGAAGLMLTGYGLTGVLSTWKHYRRQRAWANSPWKKFCRENR